MSRLHKHFNTAIAPPVVSQEGILDGVIQKARKLFKSEPMDVAKDRDKLQSKFGVVATKELSTYLQRHFPGGRVPKNMVLKTDTVSADEIASKLAYRNQLDVKDPIGFLTKAIAEMQRAAAPFYAESERSSKQVVAIDKELKAQLGQFYNKHIKDDYIAEGEAAPDDLRNEVYRMINDATEKVDALVYAPFKTVPREGYYWLGNWHTTVKTAKDAMGATIYAWAPTKESTDALPKELPALNAAQIEAALKFIKMAMMLEIRTHYSDGWLDHSDGHIVSEQLEELLMWDYLVDSRYYDTAYHQHVYDVQAYHVPYAQDPSNTAVMGLLLWIDRSIAK